MSLAVENDLAPFGWYPDPANSGMLRWWNGRQWTDHLEYPRPEVHPAIAYSSSLTPQSRAVVSELFSRRRPRSAGVDSAL